MIVMNKLWKIFGFSKIGLIFIVGLIGFGYLLMETGVIENKASSNKSLSFKTVIEMIKPKPKEEKND